MIEWLTNPTVTYQDLLMLIEDNILTVPALRKLMNHIRARTQRAVDLHGKIRSLTLAAGLDIERSKWEGDEEYYRYQMKVWNIFKGESAKKNLSKEALKGHVIQFLRIWRACECRIDGLKEVVRLG